MKINLPITGAEFPTPDSATLLSTTDLQGRVTYANAAFLEVSGFAHHEMVGQNHHIVRHPDMPAEAFRDMWATLKAGDSWSALVKNRRKNGDHYWVRANATPVREKGSVVGFMSVRTKPASDDVRAAEILYEQLRKPGHSLFRLYRGIRVGRGWAKCLTLHKTLSLRWRLGVICAFISVLFIAGAYLAATLASAIGIAPMAAMPFLALAVSALAYLAIDVDLVRPLHRITYHAREVASGCCSTEDRLDRVDELGLLMRAINQAGLNLRALLDDVGRQVDGVRIASREIADGNQDLSVRTEKTAANLEQTVSTMAQMQAAVAANAATTRQAMYLAEDAMQSAQKSGERVDRIVDAISEICAASRKVADISGAIDGIAFQTNLLALNAAVEAARAGELGRGFAVVASEVRNLSGRSASAAKEIKTLVDRSVLAADLGVEQVHDARKAMTELVDKVGTINSFVAEVASATAQQSTGILQVTTSVGQLEQIAQQNAALVEQTAAAAASMLTQAEQLAESSVVFRR